MRNNTLIFISLFITLAILSIFYVNDNYNIKDLFNNTQKTDTVFSTKTDTLWKDTTIIEKEFVPKTIVKIKTDTLFKANGDTIQLITESKRFDKTILSGKDTADVQVYTSGINTSLDSLKMRLKTHKEVITNTVEITKYVEKKKTFWNRFHIQPQVGVGYGVFNKNIDAYVGVGIGFDIW